MILFAVFECPELPTQIFGLPEASDLIQLVIGRPEKIVSKDFAA